MRTQRVSFNKSERAFSSVAATPPREPKPWYTTLSIDLEGSNVKQAPMRLKTSEKEAILRQTSRYASGGDTYLFGSRTNPRARGGDIDLLLLTDTKLPLKRVRELRRAILSEIGEQKLDIVNFAKKATHPFKDIALQDALKL